MTKRSNDVQYILLSTINYDYIERIGLETTLHNLLAFFIYHMKFLQIPSTPNLGQGNLIIVNNIIAAKSIVIKKGLDILECVHI